MSAATEYAVVPMVADQVIRFHTPIHTPQHSLSSTRSYTPGGKALSLHEYRKQQATPPSPASVASSEHRLKRRRGASGLNGVRSTSASSIAYSTWDFAGTMASSRPTRDVAGPTSFFSHIPPPPLAPSTPSSHFQTNNFETPSVFSSLNPAPVGSRTAEKTHNFNPIKHLPRRHPSQTETVFATVSFAEEIPPIPAATDRPATSSPTISLSRFPQPPRRTGSSPQATAANARAQHQHQHSERDRDHGRKQPPHLILSDASSIAPSRSAPPTVLHYRGASFDLVNPHKSLNLSTIETPDQRNSEQLDYFRQKSAVDTPLLAEMSRKPPRNEGDIELEDRQTPSRMLYNDLSAAHEAIATRSLRSAKSLQSVRDESKKSEQTEPILPLFTSYKTNVQALPHKHSGQTSNKPARSGSVRDRLSRVWRRGIDSFRAMDHAVAEQGGDIATIEEQRAMAGIPEPSFSDSQMASDAQAAYQSRQLKRMSASTGNLSIARAAYDDESAYESSIYLPGDRESIGYPASIIDNRRSIPFGRRIGQTDYSDSVGNIQSYAFEFADRDSGYLPSHFDAQRVRLSSAKDSTIDNILDRYRDVNTSDASLALLADNDDGLVRVSAMDLHQPAHIQESTTTLATRVSSNVSSIAPSPKTPDAFAFRPNYAFTSSDIPPPLHAPPQMLPQLPLHEQRLSYNISGLSDMTSGDTYGDTRALLLLSRGFSAESASHDTLEVAADTAAASSEALASVDNCQARMSPDTVIRVSSALSQQPVSPVSTTFQNEDVAPSGGRQTPVSPLEPLVVSAPSTSTYATPAEHFTFEKAPSTPAKTVARQNELDTPDVETARRIPKTTSPMSQRSSGVPRMWTGTPPRLEITRSNTFKRESTGGDSFADVEDDFDIEAAEDEGNEADWETVAADSRQTLPQHLTVSSMAAYDDGSFAALPGLLAVMKNDKPYDRSSSQYSGDSFMGVDKVQPLSLVPGSEHQPGLKGPQEILQPIPRHTRGGAAGPVEFAEVTGASQDRAPPSIDSSAAAKVKHKGKARATEDYQQVLLETAQDEQRQQVRSWTTEELFNNGRGPHTMSQLMSGGPSDDILYTGQQQIANSIPDQAATGSSMTVNSGQLDHEDSFSKFTVLGPKANLTGTPQGTGMREVGSSLANNSSSPYQAWSSPPIPSFTSSPPVGTPDMGGSRVVHETDTYDSPSMRIKTRPGTPGPKSPKSPKSAKSPVSPVIPTLPLTLQASQMHKVEPSDQAQSPTLRLKPSQEQFETGNLVDLREQKRREREERELARARSKTAKRASVTGQTELREMQLVRDHQHSPTESTSHVGSHHTNDVAVHRKGSVTPTSTHYSNNAAFTDGSIAAGRDSSDTGSPLFDTHPHARNAVDYLRQQASVHDQHLVNIPPAPLTEDLIAKQQTISWVLFACGALLPPLLVLYRWEVDSVVSRMTNGRILTASSTPKKLAPWVGAGLSLSILAAAVTVVILWQVGVIL